MSGIGGGFGGDEAAVKKIGGMVLAGEAYEEYCRDHGLCRKCGEVRTHRRAIKLFGKGKKWEPLTTHHLMTGEYTVYKGYCLKPGCYSMGQAKRMLAGDRRAKSRKQKLRERFRAQTGRKRPSIRRPRANPETGSVMSFDGDDDYSVGSDMSGMSRMSGFSTASGMSGSSGISGFSFRGRRGS